MKNSEVDRSCRDHLGNIFPSQRAMCRRYGISPSLYCNRRKKGWPVKASLLGAENFVTDHRGEKYPSVKAMCAAYGITPKNYYARLERGWSLEQTLTQKVQKKE